MNLKNYIQSERGAASRLAVDLGVSASYLSQLASGASPVSPERCTAIERITGGQVTRQDLRPDDYWLIWPDLPAPTETEKENTNV